MSNVSAIVKDPSGNLYTNALVIASFVGQNTTPGAGPYISGGVPQGQFETVVPGNTDSFGALAMPITGNDTITPTPSQWKFTVVSSTTPSVSFAVLITITGASQDISAALQAAAAPLIPAIAFGNITVTGLHDTGNAQVDGTLRVTGASTLGPISASGNVATAPALAANGGALNIQKTAGGTAIYNARVLDSFGNTNAQIIAFNIEQLINPSVNVNYLTFGQVTEVATPTTNTANFTGGDQTATYGSFSHFGSGSINSISGITGEGFNAGPATATLVKGASGTANCGGVVVNGIPGQIQTPTNNGNCTNLRAIDGVTNNLSSGTVTNASAIYAEAATNTGGGTITNVYGLFVADQTVGVNNFAIKTGVGKVSIGDAATFNSTVQVSTFGVGAAPLTLSGILVNNTNLAGVAQIGVLSAPVCNSAATLSGEGGRFRVDTAAASFTMTTAQALHVVEGNKGAGSTITTEVGLDVETLSNGGTNIAIRTGTNQCQWGGIFTKYNNISTAGQGVTPILAVTSQKSESAADANVLTFTPSASVGSYRVRFTMAVSAQNTATLGWTATWKDANGSAQAPTNLALFASGTAAPALTVTAATNGNYYGTLDIDTDASATNIVVKLTFAGTSFTAKVTVTIERIN